MTDSLLIMHIFPSRIMTFHHFIHHSPLKNDAHTNDQIYTKLDPDFYDHISFSKKK